MSQQRMPAPKHVRILPEGVAISWQDGHETLYGHYDLRLRCACATCVGEWPKQRGIDVRSVPRDVQAVEYLTIGNYAVQFLWSDFHSTGIYPYRMLRELCPCPECAARRGKAQGAPPGGKAPP